MGNFQGGGNRGGGGGGFRGNDRGGRPSYGGNRGGGDRDRGPVTMHKAVCDECHKSCEVPFRPSSDKPIYCNDCFSSKREDSPRPPRNDFGDRGPKRDFGSKPAFARPAGMPMGDDVKKQLSEMNSKLDRLVSAIEKMTMVKEPVKVMSSKPEVKAPAKKVVAKAPVKKVAKVASSATRREGGKVVAKKKK
jgi:CxxC-x17-CxxC domain-containing protein